MIRENQFHGLLPTMKLKSIFVWLSSSAFIITSSLLLYMLQFRESGTLVMPGRDRQFSETGRVSASAVRPLIFM